MAPFINLPSVDGLEGEVGFLSSSLIPAMATFKLCKSKRTKARSGGQIHIFVRWKLTHLSSFVCAQLKSGLLTDDINDHQNFSM